MFHDGCAKFTTGDFECTVYLKMFTLEKILEPNTSETDRSIEIELCILYIYGIEYHKIVTNNLEISKLSKTRSQCPLRKVMLVYLPPVTCGGMDGLCAGSWPCNVIFARCGVY